MTQRLEHRFVDAIPASLEEGTVYVCIPYGTVNHLCCCGCGHEIATPLSPTDWNLTYNGKTVSLHPSIGNWSYPCRSHYWIRQNQVHWSPALSPADIEQGRRVDLRAKQQYFKEDTEQPEPKTPAKDQPVRSAWQRLLRWLQRYLH